MHDDDDAFRRANYLRLFGTSAEHEVEERESTERAAKIKSDEVMAWARQRAAEREAETSRRREVPYDGAGQPLPIVTKSYGAPVTQSRAAASASLTAEWQSWIEARIQKESREAEECMAKAIRIKLDKSNTAMIKAIADTMIKEEKAREKADAELTARVAKLETELAELRGAAAAQRANPASSVADERRRAGALTRARQEIERLRAAGLKCDGDARDLDLSRVRGAFDEWRH